MKNLKNFAVRVSNLREKNIATTFYRRATKRGFSNCRREYDDFPGYVGMTCNHGLCDFNGPKGPQRSVSVNVVYHKWDHETAVPFSLIKSLADTPQRRTILSKLLK
jgi:hypothetical protein